MTRYELTVYVLREDNRVRAAVEAFRRSCSRRLGAEAFDICVVDVLANPELAEAERIIVTPTVVRDLPLPRRRAIGDLLAVDALATALELPEDPIDGGDRS
jgi:circadian clock protein KaiB